MTSASPTQPLPATPPAAPVTEASLHGPVADIARTDFATLPADATIEQALAKIRASGLGERVVYFYVVDDDGRLAGVIPTRRLLMAPLERSLADVMIQRVVTLPEHATVLEAHEQLARHRYLALPVVDDHGRPKGVVDVSMFIGQDLDAHERDAVSEVFETLGFRVEEVRGASALHAFRFRFPWLLSTIAGGTACALVASAYGATLAASLVLAFFLTLVLGLGESVAMQSMTVTIQTLRSRFPSFRWYLRALWREARTAALLGAAAGLLVAGIVWLWRGEAAAAGSIGASILLVIVVGSFWGLTIPTTLHALRLDPKVAAGPVTLAVTDICTLLIYLTLALLLL